MNSYETHQFYCINCGKAGIPIPRMSARYRAKGHRKLLYCPWCKQEINHIECCNEQEVNKFLKDFQEGKYLEEAKESISFSKGDQYEKESICDVRMSRFW